MDAQPILGQYENPCMTSSTAATARSSAAAPTSSPPPPVAQAPSPGLKLGESGADVKALQQCLVRLGYLSEKELRAARGSFDKATWNALAKFKSEHGLRAVGVYGQKAASALTRALGQGYTPGQAAPAGNGKPGTADQMDPAGRAGRSGPVEVGDIKDMTYEKAAAIVRAHGGKVCPNGQPTVLAIRTRNDGTRQYEDHFVVLRPDGKMKVFDATTRPTSTTSGGSYNPTMVLPGNYELWPRWRDGKFNNDAFIIGQAGEDMSIPAAVDRNGDGRYSKDELSRPIQDNEIRLHRGNSNGTTSSAGCFNVKDYDAFLKFLGGRDARFNMTLIEA